MDWAVQQLSPARTVVTSFSPRKPSTSTSASSSSSAFEEGDWILALAVNNNNNNNSGASSGTSTISCALSNGTVQVYDAQRLHVVASFTPGCPNNNNNNMITDLIYYSDSVLVTTSQDGSVVVTDLRQQPSSPVALRTSIPPRNSSSNNNNHPGAPQPHSVESALTVDLGLEGHIAAVGSSRASIYFFDLRNTRDHHLLGSYRDSHTQAVTKVRFHPQQCSLLCSGGDDGLICCFDTTQSTEELALQTVLNVGEPCRQFGFCVGGGGGGTDVMNLNDTGSWGGSLYCLTGNETVSLWDTQTATCLQTFGGSNLRDSLSQQTTMRPSSASASASTSASSFTSVPIQYLVDAHWDSARRELLLCAGNSEGDAALFTCRDGVHWQLQNTLVGGHRGVVRAWSPVAALGTMGLSPVLVTVGEDARLCEWNRLGPAVAQQQQQRRPSGATAAVVAGKPSAALLTSQQGGGPVRRQRRHSHKSMAAPY